MKSIGLYCSTLNIPFLIGCNRYAQSLIKEQRQMTSGSADYSLFAPSQTNVDENLEKEFSLPIHPVTPQTFSDSKHQLWHMLTDAPAPFEKISKPYIVTCHGLTLFHLKTQTAKRQIPGEYWDYLDFPDSIHKAFTKKDFLSKAKKLFYQRRLSKIHEQGILQWEEHLKNAHMIIAVSQFVKNEIIEGFQIPEKKIQVIYESADSSFAEPQPKEILKKHQLPEKYVLCVTNLQHVKNIKALFELSHYLKKNNSDLKVVYAFLNNPYEDRYLKQLEELNLEIGKDIFLLKNIPQDDLKSVIQNCHVFVNLAWIETFGLPIVEAMKSGVPIISSDRCALGEVISNGGITLDPNQQESFFQKVLETEKTPLLLDQLKKQSLERGKFFSWRKAALETIKIYEDILQTPLLNQEQRIENEI